MSSAPIITDLSRAWDAHESPSGNASTGKKGRQTASLRWAIVGGTGVAGILHVANVVVNFALAIVLARTLSPDDFGIYAISMNNAQLLATVIGFGIPFTVVRFFPQYMSICQFGHARGVAHRLATATYASSGFFALGGLIIMLVLSRVIFLEHLNVYLITILLAALLCVGNYQMELARASKQLVLAYFPTRVAWTVTVLVTLSAIFFAGTQINVVGVLIISAVLLLVLLVIQHEVLRRMIRRLLGDVEPKYESRDWYRVTLPLWITMLGTTIVATADLLAVGMLAGSLHAATYFAAKKLASLVGFTLLASNSIVAPLISEHFYAKRRHELETTLAYAALLVFVPALLSAIALLAAGPFALRMFGEEFTAAWPILLVLVFGQLINASTGAVGYLVILTGHEMVSAIVVTGAAIVQISLCLLLMPTIGVFGAAIANAVSLTAWNICLVAYIWRRLHLNPTILGAIRLMRLRRETT